MLEKILEKLVKMANPGRDISVERIAGLLVMSENDIIGCNNYLLEGKYTYNEVVALNELTADDKYGRNHCGFGFCKEIGPVAFIGVYNPHFCNTSGYFRYNVHEYGTSTDDSEYYWKVYSDEDAKNIGNYTVYGECGLENVASKAFIAKVTHCFDSRYKSKKDMGYNKDKTIIEMDFKLSGTYSFAEARLLSTGTTKDKEAFTGEEHPIQFALVGESQYVGIINLWKHENDLYFKDVWEYACDEPKLQSIRYLSKEEAKKVDNFELYVYKCPYSLKTKEYPIEKKDRTFDKRFKFRLSDGTDYRVI